MNQSIIDLILVPFINNLFIVFGIVSFAVGVALIIEPVRLLRFCGVMNNWVSCRNRMRWLVIPRDTGQFIQRFRYLIGLIFVVAAVYSTIILMTQIDVSRLVAALRVESMNAFVSWTVESIRWLLIVGSTLVIVTGMMLIFFPDGILALEKHTNHWYSFRKNSRGGDTMHMHIDMWAERFPRTLGWIVAAGALVVVLNNSY